MVMLVAAPAVAPAQTQAGGIFGASAKSGPAPKQSADLYLSVGEAYDSDTPEAFRATIDPLNPQSGGYFTNLQANGSFSWGGKGIQFGATGGSAFRYFGSLNELKSIGHNLGVGFDARLPSRVTLSVNQNAAYSPSYLYSLFPREADSSPGAAPPIAPDYDANDFESYTFSTSVGLERAISRRTRASISGQMQKTDFLRESSTRQDLRGLSGRAALERNLSRNVAFTAGYNYRTDDIGYTGSGTSTEHGPDIALTYKRPLSATRQMDFAFKVGGSSVAWSSLPVGQTLTDGDVLLWSAEASAGYQFNSRWQTRAMYRRGIQHVLELPEPVSTEGFLASLDGLWTQRMDFTASAGYSKGQSALTRSGLAFDTYMGEARLRYRLTGNVAVYVQYLYYFYDFHGNTAVIPGLASSLERNGVRAGLTLWVPALRR
jgi:hypothetical protein